MKVIAKPESYLSENLVSKYFVQLTKALIDDYFPFAEERAGGDLPSQYTFSYKIKSSALRIQNRLLFRSVNFYINNLYLNPSLML